MRLRGVAALADILGEQGSIGSQIARFVRRVLCPVRAILFDKTATTNWALAWHQDRTICVRGRRDVAGFGPWTVKSGLLHVAPPFDLLERMVTVRIHLDDVPADNAPLLIAPGSHRFGLVREERIDAVVAECGVQVCTALAGDIWVYATPILHASDAVATPRRRRVLQVDYAGFDLPEGLQWSGI
ncbi:MULTISPECIES: phytanoyl-CoA dioxygenase family protein [unclassified Sphingomonas]|uniref:phytanoyl-CoA dioxygenase family protein n=1 Tax=unclassified Sphingomonas TaxID=196159 RepID=UPI0021509BFC|nr:MULTISPECIES: phytanoyl-CoA dioxygenase family protein [unclassified Sphingomonas]MCR5870607.1 phytanoyl-CoA dioxygenase family protein [Sphingomonas sp. J344]UUY01048.1 phytanoyl-CoA dioxygenase family protein [Sphingomonas sp. J315]